MYLAYSFSENTSVNTFFSVHFLSWKQKILSGEKHFGSLFVLTEKVSEKETAPASALPMITLMIFKIFFTEKNIFEDWKHFSMWSHVWGRGWELLSQITELYINQYISSPSCQQVYLSSLVNPSSMWQLWAFSSKENSSDPFRPQGYQNYLFLVNQLHSFIHKHLLRHLGQSFVQNKWATHFGHKEGIWVIYKHSQIRPS